MLKILLRQSNSSPLTSSTSGVLTSKPMLLKRLLLNELSVFQRLYLDKGSAGLKEFVKKRIKSAEDLTSATNRYRRYYASIKTSSLQVESEAMQTQIRMSFDQLEDLYPAARFADVFFLIGKMSTGGTVSNKGLLIGTELFSRTADSPTDELNEWLKQVTRPVEVIPAM